MKKPCRDTAAIRIWGYFLNHVYSELHLQVKVHHMQLEYPDFPFTYHICHLYTVNVELPRGFFSSCSVALKSEEELKLEKGVVFFGFLGGFLILFLILCTGLSLYYRSQHGKAQNGRIRGAAFSGQLRITAFLNEGDRYQKKH